MPEQETTISQELEYFSHIHLNTEYSINDGIVRIPNLAQKAKDLGFKALVLTDKMNLFATVKFYSQCIKNKIKPIIGCQLLIEDEENKSSFHLLALVKTNTGFVNLKKILTKSYIKSKKQATVRFQSLLEHKEDLIFILPNTDSDLFYLWKNKSMEALEKRVEQWQNLLGQQIYISIERNQKKDQEAFNQTLINIAKEKQIPLVVSNHVKFIEPDEYYAHEAKVSIATSNKLEEQLKNSITSQEQYFKSVVDMNELFSDIPEALKNTAEIVKMCNLKLELGKIALPKYPMLEDNQTESEVLCLKAKEGLEYICNDNHFDETKKQHYLKRIEYELDVIIAMKFEGYFLIVMEFINWAKNNQIPVGPGRGSGAGSLVAYALKITSVDPIEYGLIFERFLNPERVSMPDFDVDFCINGRERVINHVIELYGKKSVSQIATFGTLSAKAVVRDVARVLGKPYNLGDRISRLIPNVPKIKLADVVKEKELKQMIKDEEEVKEIIDLSFKLEGMIRNVGTHAGGIVISPTDINDFSALYQDKNDKNASIITHFDKDDIESIGLIKFDFLGLETLTNIKHISENIEQKLNKKIDFEHLNMDDMQVFKMLAKGTSMGVFQLESYGMQDYLVKMKVDSFNDVVDLLALFRPGPLQSGMVQDYIDRKLGKEFELDPNFGEIVKDTKGVIIYQEQVMKIAQVVANYTLGEADLLRRAMGKKKAEEMRAQETHFIQGSAKNNIDEKSAKDLFELIDKFSGYGFNKSHSVAYAFISYQTAFLKYYYTDFFYAEMLSSSSSNPNRMDIFIHEAKNFGIKVFPPEINKSKVFFEVLEEKILIFSLSAIKGIGEDLATEIVEIRKNKGDFNSLFDFCNKLAENETQLRKNSLEALIYSGAMDKIIPSRKMAIDTLDKAIKLAQSSIKEKQMGLNSIFASEKTDEYDTTYVSVDDYKNEYPVSHLAEMESKYMGMYLCYNPLLFLSRYLRYIQAEVIDKYQNRYAWYACNILSSNVKIQDEKITVNMVLGGVKLRANAALKKQELFYEYREYIKDNQTLMVQASQSNRGNKGVFYTLENICTVDEFLKQKIKGLKLKLNEKSMTSIYDLKELFTHKKDQFNTQYSDVVILFDNEKYQAEIKLPQKYQFEPSLTNLSFLDNIQKKYQLSLELINETLK